MVAIQLLVLALFASAHTRTIWLQELEDRPYVVDVTRLAQEDFEDALTGQHFESMYPANFNRIRRQLGSMSTNIDGSVNLNLKVPIKRGESNVLSAASGIQSADVFRAAGAKLGPGYTSAGGGLALDNINGHGLSVTGQQIPGLGNQATAAARSGLINTPDHKLGANAFVTRNSPGYEGVWFGLVWKVTKVWEVWHRPNLPNFPNFNIHGGGVDYTFKDKIGGSLGMAHTDLFKKTDYLAIGNLNLYRNPSSSLGLNAGWTKSQSAIPAFNHN